MRVLQTGHAISRLTTVMQNVYVASRKPIEPGGCPGSALEEDEKGNTPMATATLKTAAFGAAKAAPASKGNFLQRFWNALIEAQLRKAEREIAMHLHFIPDADKSAGFRRTLDVSNVR